MCRCSLSGVVVVLAFWAAAPPKSHASAVVSHLMGDARVNRASSLTAYPCIIFTAQPESRVSCDGTAPFSVEAIGAGTLMYQWQIEVQPGVWFSLGNDPGPISCPPSVGFAYAAPINSPSVLIGVRGCPGPYRVRCLVTDDCGNDTSDPATLTICPADYNCNGVLDSQDFFDFLAAFFQDAADFNHDSATNSQDYFDFLGAFFSGCA
ncbi:MAG: hypothetical protein AB7G11_14125 [Phycisphaerales bacterium]